VYRPSPDAWQPQVAYSTPVSISNQLHRTDTAGCACSFGVTNALIVWAVWGLSFTQQATKVAAGQQQHSHNDILLRLQLLNYLFHFGRADAQSQARHAFHNCKQWCMASHVMLHACNQGVMYSLCVDCRLAGCIQ
jgi:hypothetical protein